MIFIDSNIPMYLVGSPHPNKAQAERLLHKLVLERQRLVTDSEVLQEILHRYVAINRRDAIQPAFDALLAVVDDVFPIDLESVERARQIVLGYTELSARDAVHVAIMEKQQVGKIISFDAGFDHIPSLVRLC